MHLWKGLSFLPFFCLAVFGLSLCISLSATGYGEAVGLCEKGVIDFAGGIVVHATAGASALTLAWMLGRRQGFPKTLKPPHNPGMVMIGASMLWVGWFGFNAGSAAAANESAGMAMLVTHISAATASLVWMFIEWKKPENQG